MEENSTKKQILKENRQENLLADLALSAKEQIQNQVEKDLEPKLEELLARNMLLLGKEWNFWSVSKFEGLIAGK